MSTFKGWFRRRAPEDEETAHTDDPFSGEADLDLMTLNPGTGRVRVPPPPRAPTRPGRMLGPDAFAFRPTLAPRPDAGDNPAADEPITAAPAPAAANPPPRRNVISAAFQLRRAGMPGAAAGAARTPEERLASSAKEPPRRSRAPAPEAAESETAPSFSLEAPSPFAAERARAPSETGQRNARLRDAFTPTRPKQDATLFAGRRRELERIIAAIEEERAHVVIYGERGSGKTSLANMLATKAGEAGYHVLHFACGAETSFEAMFRSFLRRIPSSFLLDSLGAGNPASADSLESLLPDDGFGVIDVISVLTLIRERHIILIIDEYDRVSDEALQNKLAELIKITSDAAAPATLVIVGVAEDVRQLFGRHPSLQRTLVTVPMPLMTRRDIDRIISAGEARSGLAFLPEVRRAIADFAQGLPYHAQLLSLLAARNAIRRRSERVEGEDFRYAVEQAAEEAEGRTKDAYLLAAGSTGKESFEDALFFAACAHCDAFGSFTAGDVAAAAGEEGTTAAEAVAEQLTKLTKGPRGAVLRRVPSPGAPRFQFSSQMMRHYVLARQATRRGLI